MYIGSLFCVSFHSNKTDGGVKYTLSFGVRRDAVFKSIDFGYKLCTAVILTVLCGCRNFTILFFAYSWRLNILKIDGWMESDHYYVSLCMQAKQKRESLA